jgi:hypothetical protein
VIYPTLLIQLVIPNYCNAISNVVACPALGLSNRDDAMTQLVAEKIIELAKRGLENPTALHLAAMKEFNSDPQ